MKETSGVLVSDPRARQLRLDAAGQPVFVVPYDRLAALHYEEAEYPRRFLRRSSFYLTVYYLDEAGLPAVEIIRLLSRREALAAIGALETDTGLTVDRSLTAQSFLGIPIRAGVGARVVVTDQTGQVTRGVLTRLSPASLALDDPSGTRREFSEAGVRKIRLLYSPKHDALVGFAFGAGLGAYMTYLSAALGGCFNGASRQNDCHFVPILLGATGAVGGLGALIGTTIGAFRYPFNDAFDVYRGDLRSASRTTVTIAPQLAPQRKGVTVFVRF